MQILSIENDNANIIDQKFLVLIITCISSNINAKIEKLSTCIIENTYSWKFMLVKFVISTKYTFVSFTYIFMWYYLKLTKQNNNERNNRISEVIDNFCISIFIHISINNFCIFIIITCSFFIIIICSFSKS